MKKIYLLLMAYILLSPCLLKAQLFDPSYHIGRHRIRRLLKEGFQLTGIKVDTIMADSISKIDHKHRPETREKYRVRGRIYKDTVVDDTIEKDIIITNLNTSTAMYCVKLYKDSKGKWGYTSIPVSHAKWKYDTIYYIHPKHIAGKRIKDTIDIGDLLVYKDKCRVKKFNNDKREVGTKIVIFRRIHNDRPDYQGRWTVSSGTTSPMRFYELKHCKTGLFRELKSPNNDDSMNLNYIYTNDSISLAINPSQFIKINSINWFVSAISLAYRTAPYNLQGYTISGATPIYTGTSKTQTTPTLVNYKLQQMGTGGALGPFNLGPVFGLTWSNNCLGPQVNQSEWALSLGVGLPITVTQLAKEPLQKIKSIPGTDTTYYNPSASSISSVISSLYISPCIVFGISTHNIGIVFTYGQNYMIGPYSTNWLYFGRNTFGIGLGVTIL